MRDGLSYTYAQTIDPAGGIWPSREANGKTLDAPLEATRALNNAVREARPAKRHAAPPSPALIHSEQVAKTKPPIALTPSGPMKDAVMAVTHHAMTRRDAGRIVSKFPHQKPKPVLATPSRPPRLTEVFSGINKAALQQMKRGRSQNQDRDVGRG